ncbi:exodeoxyribonuclease V subunit gamma [Burkholderiaceae bacterium DAT-1]|nr:exodeoxyribonuclease V subunit gamma [Burkholderiaceae bacterium DAT-1]
MTASTPFTGLTILHANRAESLRDVVIGWLAAHPLPGIFDEDIFLTQSQGMQQWLKMAMAERLGIASGADFQLPSQFVWSIYRTVLGEADTPQHSLLDKDRLVWILYRVLPDWSRDPLFARLASYLEDDKDARKRYQLAEQLADLFDQYQVYRADWLLHWQAGHDDVAIKGKSVENDSTHWQAALWRRLHQALGKETDTSRALIHTRFLAAMRDPARVPVNRLPKRVIVFGLSSLPRQTLEALAALSEHCHVLMAVNNPCRHYWGDIIEDRHLLRQQTRHRLKPGMPVNIDESLLHQHANPLLAAWGKQGRDYINLLSDHDRWEDYKHAFANADIDLFDSDPATPPTLLNQLQWAITDLQPLPQRDQPKRAYQADDRSVRIHVAHSALREVEILHDQLLALFADASLNLQPRDVLVMVPDINGYAPFVRAVFGRLERKDDRYIPWAIADQAERESEPILRAIDHLLNLADARFAVSDVLDLMDVPAVAQRFGFGESDHLTLRRWIHDSGIRWGLDDTHRSRFTRPFAENSWQAGLNRMLLGYASGNAGMWSGIVPYDEVAGLEAQLAGKLARLMQTLGRHATVLQGEHTPADWVLACRALLAEVLDAQSEQDQLVLARFESALDGWLDRCRDTGMLDTLLPMTVVRDVILGDFSGQSVSMRFLGGSVNIGTLMPMRAIPFKVICLLGLNDGDYPRQSHAPDFDLMAQDYRPGDRSRREDDRYLFLEAVMSARERLYLSYVGRSVADDHAKPPSVLLGQLMDYVDAGWIIPDKTGPDALVTRAIVTTHPLQPFSERYFASSDQASSLFSYAHEWRDVHNQTQATEVNHALPEVAPETEVSIATLTRFLRQPVSFFMQERLKVRFEESDPVDDIEPFALDGLTGFGLKQRLLQAVLNAAPDEIATDWSELSQRLRGEGVLPVGTAGQRWLDQQYERSVALRERLGALQNGLSAEARPLPLRAEGGDPAWLCQHPLDRLWRHTDGSYTRLIVRVGESAPHKKPRKLAHLLPFWAEHLLANACGHTLRTLLVSESATTLALTPIEQQDAHTAFNTLVQAMRTGLNQPLPIASSSALALLENENDIEAARKAFEGCFASTGEVQRSPELARVYPEFDSFDETEFIDLAHTLYGAFHAAVEEIADANA